MAGEYKPLTHPFENHGLVTKVDPAQLKPGQFQVLSNITSLQEGAITTCRGTQRMNQDNPVAGLTHTIAKLRTSFVEADSFRYLGVQQVIYRGAADDAGPFTLVGRLDTDAVLGLDSTLYRWSSEDYATGVSGNPSKYFATRARMLKDDGTFNPLQVWGIKPPTRPVLATLDFASIVKVVDFESATALTGTGITTGFGDRLSAQTLAASVNPIPFGASPGQMIEVALSSALVGILPGQRVKIGNTEYVVIDALSPTTITAYFLLAHASGSAVADSFESMSVAAAGNFQAVTGGGFGPIDLSLNGKLSNENAYDSPDNIHISLFVSDPTQFTDIRVQLDVSDTAGAFTDYYERSISINTLTDLVKRSQTAVDAETNQAILTNLNVIGDDGTLLQLPPIYANSWAEIDILKTDFTKVGRAGAPDYSWKVVKAVRVAFTTLGPAALQMSTIYGAGGQFPQASQAVPNAPYAYLATFRNDVTGLEGNPCVEMIADNLVEPSRQFVRLTLSGTADPQISTTSSHKTIAIYRQGGVFADGLYRLIGYATNPGYDTGADEPLTVQFIDNVPDTELVDARVIEFDNDPPVSSNLKIPLTATISDVIPTSLPTAGNADAILTLTIQTPAAGDLTQIVTIGSPLTIGSGSRQETALIKSVNPSQVKVYCQRPHDVGESVSASYAIGVPCRLCCQAFGSFFLAGDPNNPHILYKSKTARPEAWPIVNLASGASGSIVVGTPSNPIMAITEYEGEVLVMTLTGLSVLRVWQGQMQAPIETPAKRGLMTSFGWCKVGNEIWYLAYDGIYSWSGGQERKRSEAIDPMFLGETVNGIPPIDMTSVQQGPFNSAGLEFVTMAYHNHEVNMTYRDTQGNSHRLRYSLIYDRWYIRDDETPGSVYAMHVDEDTGIMPLGKYVGETGNTYIEHDDLGTSGSWITDETDGTAIAVDAFTEFYNLGSPGANKHFGDLLLELDNDGAVSLQVAIYWDFATTADSNNTFAISSIPGRRTVVLPIVNSGALLVGHDARAMAVRITGSSTKPIALYSLTFNSLPLELVQRGRAYDWDYLGHPYDKKLEQLIIEYDMGQAAAQTVTLCLDTKSGIAGITETLAAQTFTLTGTGRCKANLGILPDIVAKMIRLRPLTFAGAESTSFMIWDYAFQKEDYPADIAFFTEYEDSGTQYDKYYQQVDLDVDTGGVDAVVTLFIDNGAQSQNFTVNTTAQTRNKQLTCNPNLKGKKARLLITPGTGGKFQMFSHSFIVLPADKGPVSHTFDYDELGHPWDKRLRTVTFEYDTQGNSTTVQMDTISGIKGSTITTNVQRFLLDGAGRSKVNFPIKLDTIAKMVRLYPLADNVVFKEWKYYFDKIDYPPDTVFFTEANDMGYPCEKILRELTIDMDTGGVACLVGVEIDGVVQFEFSMTTTLNDKSRMITMPSRPDELIGKLFRLIFTPGAGGKAQYFTHNFNHIIEPCRIYHTSSFEQNFGSNGRKLMKRVWVELTSYDEVTVTIYTDDRQLFYQKVLPAHPYRDVETFLLPAINGGVLNKSYIYAVDFDSCDTFKIYRDSCRVEVRNLNGDAREPWQQKYLFESMPIPGDAGS